MANVTDAEIIQWVVKGGPGSGAQPGHDFEGNQWGQGGGQGHPPAALTRYISKVPDGLSRAGRIAAATDLMTRDSNPTLGSRDDLVSAIAARIPSDVASQVTPHDMAVLEDENYHTTTEAIIARNPSLSRFPSLSSYGS